MWLEEEEESTKETEREQLQVKEQTQRVLVMETMGRQCFQRGGHGQESNAAERLRNMRTENIPWISQHAGHW